MTPKEDIQAELTAVSGAIDGAREALARNQIVDIDDIPERVRGVADAITDLEPEDAIEMRSPLVNLLADFKDFAEELQTKIDQISSAGEADGGTVVTGQSGD